MCIVLVQSLPVGLPHSPEEEVPPADPTDPEEYFRKAHLTNRTESVESDSEIRKHSCTLSVAMTPTPSSPLIQVETVKPASSSSHEETPRPSSPLSDDETPRLSSPLSDDETCRLSDAEKPQQTVKYSLEKVRC